MYVHWSKWNDTIKTLKLHFLTRYRYKEFNKKDIFMKFILIKDFYVKWKLMLRIILNKIQFRIFHVGPFQHFKIGAMTQRFHEKNL